eukprot:scaffold67023_cov62-Phaeocystis_antarctica.AAC.6
MTRPAHWAACRVASKVGTSRVTGRVHGVAGRVRGLAGRVRGVAGRVRGVAGLPDGVEGEEVCLVDVAGVAQVLEAGAEHARERVLEGYA